MSGRRETFVSGLRYVPDYLESDTHDRLLAEVDAQPWHAVGDVRRIQFYGHWYTTQRVACIESANFRAGRASLPRVLCRTA